MALSKGFFFLIDQFFCVKTDTDLFGCNGEVHENLEANNPAMTQHEFLFLFEKKNNHLRNKYIHSFL